MFRLGSGAFCVLLKSRLLELSGATSYEQPLARRLKVEQDKLLELAESSQRLGYPSFPRISQRASMQCSGVPVFWEMRASYALAGKIADETWLTEPLPFSFMVAPLFRVQGPFRSA